MNSGSPSLPIRSVPASIAFLYRSLTLSFSTPHTMTVMMPESELTMPVNPSLPRSRSVTISRLKAMPTCSLVMPCGIE